MNQAATRFLDSDESMEVAEMAHFLEKAAITNPHVAEFLALHGPEPTFAEMHEFLNAKQPHR